MRKNLEGTLKTENNPEVQFETLVLALYHYFGDKK